MRIAIPLVDAGTLAEEFSQAPQFALYEVHDDTRTVAYLGRHPVADPGCGRTPGVMREHGVEVVLGHRVSEKAANHLLEVGIVAITDAPLITADALISHLVSGTLQAKAPEVAMHGECCSGHACRCQDNSPDHVAADPAANPESCCDHTTGCCQDSSSGCDNTPGCCDHGA